MAQSLFEQARAEMASGQFDTACPKLEEVIKLEPSGAGAKLKLAECYEGAGRFASAFATYGMAEAACRQAGQLDRAAWAAERAGEVRARVSTLTIRVSPKLAALPGLSVMRAGELVGPPQWGAAILVDGGQVTVVTSAPGHVAAEKTVTVAKERDAVELQLDELEPLATPPRVASSQPAPGTPHEPGSPPAVPTWAWVTGSLGLASGLVAIGFRVDQALIEADQADACGPQRDACPRSYDVDGTNRRKQLDFGLFVGLGASGVAALGAGVVGAIVGMSRPHEPRQAGKTAVMLVPHAMGLGLLGEFE